MFSVSEMCLYQYQNFVYESSKCSDETVCMHGLVLALTKRKLEEPICEMA